MKKALILSICMFVFFISFSQTNITTEITDVINAINKIGIGKKADHDEQVVAKHIFHTPGANGINQLIKNYEKDGKWVNDGIKISDELKPYINVKDNTLVYTSKIDADLETIKFDLDLKVEIVKTEEGEPLVITYYINYHAFNADGIPLVSFEMP